MYTRMPGHDRYAVSTLQNDNMIGHIPREYSKVAWYFLQHDDK